MNYRLIRQIPTNIGRSVHIAESQSHGLVVVKQAFSESCIQDLRNQIGHLEAMHRIVGLAGPYPPIIEHSPTQLITPYYPHGTVEDLGKQGHNSLLRHYVTRSIHHLFHIAKIRPTSSVPHDTFASFSNTYLVDEATLRLTRLLSAIRKYPKANRWSDSPLPGSSIPHRILLNASTSWIINRKMDNLALKMGIPPLGISAHGDLVLNNVLLNSFPHRGGDVIFIDTRGRWHSGVPWWDPILDLATLIVFHCLIPTISHSTPISGTGPSTYSAQLSEDDILGLCQSDSAFLSWTEHDPSWYIRLQYHKSVRLLGNISMQLTHAPSVEPVMATKVLLLFYDQVQVLETTAGVSLLT